MKLPKLAVAIVFVFGSVVAAHAQLCGSFYVQLDIGDVDSGTVRGYSIEVVPMGVDELRGKRFEPVKDRPDVAQMSLLEGHVIQGKYRVIVSAPRYQPSERIIRFPHCRRVSYEIRLVKQGQTRTRVSGRVSDQGGNAITDANIKFTDARGFGRYARPDFEGVYEIKLNPGDYSVTANAPDHEQFTLDKFIVPTNGEAELELIMKADRSEAKPLVPLTGTVYDANQARIAGVTVTATDATGRKFVTVADDAGRFRRVLPVGDYSLLFEFPNFRPTRIVKLHQSLAAQKPINVRMEVGRCEDCNGAIYGERWDDFTQVQGTVYNVKGFGLPRASVHFYDVTGNEVHTATTATGSYSIKLPIHTEDTYKIKVESPGFQPYWIERYRFPTMQRGKITLDFVLEPTVCDGCD